LWASSEKKELWNLEDFISAETKEKKYRMITTIASLRIALRTCGTFNPVVGLVEIGKMLDLRIFKRQGIIAPHP
jgi:hypothetical protein